MAEEPEATRKKFKIVTNAKEAEQHFHFPKQPVAPNSNIQKQKVKVEGGSSIMILALIIVFAIVIFAVLSLKSNGELPRPSPTVTDARTNSPPHDTESPQPQPVDYVRQVLPTINNEPLLIKSTEKATRAQYENNAVICDAWKDLQRLPNSKWVGIRAIVNRYLNEGWS